MKNHLLSPITPSDTINKWEAHPTDETLIIGTWAEDGSRYTLKVPHQLRDSIIMMQNSLASGEKKYVIFDKATGYYLSIPGSHHWPVSTWTDNYCCKCDVIHEAYMFDTEEEAEAVLPHILEEAKRQGTATEDHFVVKEVSTVDAVELLSIKT